jgi:hypothetical protein
VVVGGDLGEYLGDTGLRARDRAESLAFPNLSNITPVMLNEGDVGECLGDPKLGI